MVYSVKGDYDRAIADYTKAIELHPQNPLPYGLRGLAYNERGRGRNDLSDQDRAIADYTKMIELDPTNAVTYNNRAWAYFTAGKAAQGLPDAEKSLELRPDNYHALDTRGSIFEALGRRDEAIADFRRAMSLGTNDPEVQALGREALKRLGVE
jgi:tetratricopeptide (TPR) repeat protein